MRTGKIEDVSQRESKVKETEIKIDVTSRIKKAEDELMNINERKKVNAQKKKKKCKIEWRTN